MIDETNSDIRPGENLYPTETASDRLQAALDAAQAADPDATHAMLDCTDVAQLLTQLRIVGLLANISPGTLATASERERQLTEEGYTFGDDLGRGGELSKAAAAYLRAVAWMLEGNYPAEGSTVAAVTPWPWGKEYWKPEGPTRTAVKAAALAVAAVDALLADETPRTGENEVVNLG